VTAGRTAEVVLEGELDIANLEQARHRVAAAEREAERAAAAQSARALGEQDRASVDLLPENCDPVGVCSQSVVADAPE